MKTKPVNPNEKPPHPDDILDWEDVKRSWVQPLPPGEESDSIDDINAEQASRR